MYPRSGFRSGVTSAKTTLWENHPFAIPRTCATLRKTLFTNTTNFSMLSLKASSDMKGIAIGPLSMSTYKRPFLNHRASPESLRKNVPCLYACSDEHLRARYVHSLLGAFHSVVFSFIGKALGLRSKGPFLSGSFFNLLLRGLVVAFLWFLHTFVFVNGFYHLSQKTYSHRKVFVLSREAQACLLREAQRSLSHKMWRTSSCKVKLEGGGS